MFCSSLPWNCGVLPNLRAYKLRLRRWVGKIHDILRTRAHTYTHLTDDLMPLVERSTSDNRCQQMLRQNANTSQKLDGLVFVGLFTHLGCMPTHVQCLKSPHAHLRLWCSFWWRTSKQPVPGLHAGGLEWEEDLRVSSNATMTVG